MTDKVTSSLGEELKRNFKSVCSNDDKKMNDVVKELIEKYTARKMRLAKKRKAI